MRSPAWWCGKSNMPVSGPARGILRGLAGVDDRTGLVVVPPIGVVVVGDDDRCEVSCAPAAAGKAVVRVAAMAAAAAMMGSRVLQLVASRSLGG